jgi:hypothetical protein
MRQRETGDGRRETGDGKGPSRNRSVALATVSAPSGGLSRRPTSAAVLSDTLARTPSRDYNS